MNAGTTTLPSVPSPVVGPHYKWVVLSNTTVGVLLATLNGTSLMIALPVIFPGHPPGPAAGRELPLPALDHDGLHIGVGRRRRDGRPYRRHVRSHEDVQPWLRLSPSGRSCFQLCGARAPPGLWSS